MVQYVVMVCASIHIAAINVCEDLCSIRIGDSIRCPVVGAIHIDYANMIAWIDSCNKYCQSLTYSC